MEQVLAWANANRKKTQMGKAELKVIEGEIQRNH